jgi:ubiquinone/menaquinone biosynthesis C-methylase UbiE
VNRAAVRALEVGPSDHVLEIGFGPGHALSLLGRQAPGLRLSGLDPSKAMIRHASRCNRSLLRAQRLELREGTADRIPWPDGTFSRVLSVNNVLFWRPLDRALGEVQRVLQPGGRCLFALHSLAVRVMLGPSPEPLAAFEEVLGPYLTQAGLGPPTGRRERTWSGSGLYLLARKPL